MSRDSLERRSFFTRMNAGVVSFAALAGAAMAKPKSVSSSRWEPARHEKDDWLEQIPGKHRMVLDTTTGNGVGDALAFGYNFFVANQAEYGLENGDIAMVMILRHRSTTLGYNDAMWAKYGATMAAFTQLQDPRTKSAASVNLYNASDYDQLLPSRGVTFDAMAKQGVRFAVCSMATRGFAAGIAQATGSTLDAIVKELTANLIANARLVPAGIVAVNRAQERGYSLVTT